MLRGTGKPLRTYVFFSQALNNNNFIQNASLNLAFTEICLALKTLCMNLVTRPDFLQYRLGSGGGSFISIIRGRKKVLSADNFSNSHGHIGQKKFRSVRKKSGQKGLQVSSPPSCSWQYQLHEVKPCY